MSKLQTTDNSSTNYPLLANAERLKEVMSENFADGFDVKQLTRIKFPTSGSGGFIMPEAGGEVLAKSITGIILHERTTRALFEKSFEEDSTQNPVCTSADGRTGIIARNMPPEVMESLESRGIMPSGRCHDCPASGWDTGRNGGQACQQRKPLAILPPKKSLPIILSLPATSIRNWDRYKTLLSEADRTKIEVETEISLVKEKNRMGTEYYQAVFAMKDGITPDAVMQIKELRTALLTLDQQMADVEQFHDEKGPF